MKTPLPYRGSITLTIIIGLVFSSPLMAGWHSAQRAIMGTPVKVELWHTDANKAQFAIEQVFAEITRLDQLLSPYKKDSEVYKINHRKLQTDIALSNELYTLLERAHYYGELTQGAFDITFASVGQYYNYRQNQRPSSKQLQKFHSAIGLQKLILNSTQLKLHIDDTNTRIDLGGIAKGYAVDKAIQILKDLGIKHARVSAGGDARVLGDKHGKPWMIGIKHPRQNSSQQSNRYAAIIPLENSAISTSGDYERFFIDTDGERIHHIIDPSNGQPTGLTTYSTTGSTTSSTTGSTTDALISVSIIGPTGFDTDPLSTSVFVLGRQQGLELINQLPEFEAIVIDKDRRLHYSLGLIQPKLRPSP